MVREYENDGDELLNTVAKMAQKVDNIEDDLGFVRSGIGVLQRSINPAASEQDADNFNHLQYLYKTLTSVMAEFQDYKKLTLENTPR